MMVWQPHGNRFFETFSFLPPLSDQEIARQVQYLLNNGWTPCIEFESADKAYADSHGWSGLDSSVVAGYYDNRYWVMWKLPMYGCTNPEEVLSEIRACTSAFPDCFIRVAGFDNIKQVPPWAAAAAAGKLLSFSLNNLISSTLRRSVAAVPNGAWRLAYQEYAYCFQDGTW